MIDDPQTYHWEAAAWALSFLLFLVMWEGRGYLSVLLAKKWFMQSMQIMHMKDICHVEETHCYAIFVENLSVNNFRFVCK